MKTLDRMIQKNLPFLLSLIMLSSAFVFTSCDDDDDDVMTQTMTKPTQNIVEIAQADPELSTLVTAVIEANLQEALATEGTFYAVFAPTNDAFAALDPTTLNTIISTPSLLSALLQYHVVKGNISSTNLSSGATSTLLDGQSIDISVSSGGVTINDNTNITQADIQASNGYIHKIDKVLLPEGFVAETITQLAIRNPNFSTLVSILTMPEMSGILEAASSASSNLTVFAPTNEAFANLLAALGKTSLNELPIALVKEIVSYHILDSSVMSSQLQNGMMAETLLTGESITVDLSDGVKINNANVIAPDVEAVNGVIHGIDNVLIPSYVAQALGTVSETFLFNPDYSILTAAIKKAGLLETVSTAQNITVFAPNNDAFAAANITSLDGLDADALAPILLYHVLGKRVMAKDLPEDGMAETLNNGEKIYLGYLTNSVIINGLTTITGVDIVKSNGVVHTINRTLVPPAIDVVDIAAALADMGSDSEFTILVSLLTAAPYSDITQIIKDASDITIFAPTDKAFDAISGITLTEEQIRNVLTYHAYGGRVFSTDLSDAMSVEMVNMQNITINKNGESVSITDMSGGSDANVVEVNIHGSNGVIHVIDKVLIPTL